MNKKQQLVLFDVGAVLLELNYTGLYEAGAKQTNQTPEQFKQDYISSKIEPKVLSGEISNKQYLQELKSLLRDNSLTESQLAKIVRNCWGNQIKETVSLKKKIAEAGYSVGLFSNANQFAKNILSKEFPEMFKTYGGPKIYSYKVGAVKPNHPMFEKVQKMGFNNITYIEDNEPYVREGIEFGWNGILFTPYIDSAEAVRQTKGSHDISLSHEKFRQADNIKELEQALNDFGIKV